jgi:hypothetical protein
MATSDPARRRRLELYNALIREADVPALLGGLTVEDHLARRARILSASAVAAAPAAPAPATATCARRRAPQPTIPGL